MTAMKTMTANDNKWSKPANDSNDDDDSKWQQMTGMMMMIFPIGEFSLGKIPNSIYIYI